MMHVSVWWCLLEWLRSEPEVCHVRRTVHCGQFSSYLSNCVKSSTGGYPIRRSRFLRVDCVIRDWNVQRCRVICITSRNLLLENEICTCISEWKLRPIYLDLVKDYQYQATNPNNALQQFRWILYITRSYCADFSKMVKYSAEYSETIDVLLSCTLHHTHCWVVQKNWNPLRARAYACF